MQVPDLVVMLIAAKAQSQSSAYGLVGKRVVVDFGE